MPPLLTPKLAIKPARPSPYTTRSGFTNFGLQQVRTCALTANQANCTICLDPFSDIDPAQKILRCGHVFHRICLFAWLDASKSSKAPGATCPMCRAELFGVSPLKARRWDARTRNGTGTGNQTGSGSAQDPIDVDNMPVNPRRNLFDRRGGVAYVPSLPSRYQDGTEVLQSMAERAGLQPGFDTRARWRMDSLGLGDGSVIARVEEEGLNY
jgi:hypothetical protein